MPDENVTSMLPLSPRDFLILFALVEGERHGYGLVKDVERQSNGVVRIDPANLYRSLKRMIGQGLVAESGRRPSPESDDERRRYYRITDLGAEVVAAEASRLSELAAAARAKDLIPRSEGAQ
jgi:DNA-binding PadR family transcriptional regulator